MCGFVGGTFSLSRLDAVPRPWTFLSPLEATLLLTNTPSYLFKITLELSSPFSIFLIFSLRASEWWATPNPWYPDIYLLRIYVETRAMSISQTLLPQNPSYTYIIIRKNINMPLSPKRKCVDATADVGTKPSKQQRLDAFFLPARAAGTTAPTGQGPPAPMAKKSVIVTPKSKFESGPSLSDQQKVVMSMVVEEGRSVFFTGSAGSSGFFCMH